MQCRTSLSSLAPPVESDRRSSACLEETASSCGWPSGASGEGRALLTSLGAIPFTADLRDRRSLEAACRGVTTVASTASAVGSRDDADSVEAVDEVGQLDLVDAAIHAGVKHFVFVSFPPVNLDFSLQRAKRRVEERLRVSGIGFTVLQPSKFCEVWLSPLLGFDPVRGRARIYGTGHQSISWVSLYDVARFVAAAVKAGPSGAPAGTIVPLGGPEPISPLGVVQLFEQLGGKEVALEFIPASVIEQDFRATRDGKAQARAALALAMTFGQVVDPAPARALATWPLTHVRDYVIRVLHSACTVH